MSFIKHKRLFLFDLDGTLSLPREAIEKPIIRALQKLKKQAHVGIVSGSDLSKIYKQLLTNVTLESEQIDTENVYRPKRLSNEVIENKLLFNTVDFLFGENGATSRCYKENYFGADLSICKVLGEERYQELINFILNYLSTIKLPIKRSAFIELRSAVLNISPIGRSCSVQERKEFYKYDDIHHIRQTMVNVLSNKFLKYDLVFTIGGEISIDCYIRGWDKRLALKQLEDHSIFFDKIYFFGDKTSEEGNDYAIFIDPRVIGYRVSSPVDTLSILENQFDIQLSID